ncbi:MAG: gamma-glutamyl-gamma-aminobutyrate hydrolase family protein, partial [Bacteroidia bacterium]|nr:gamma-glutamyl-gamma-aminobutyrate hydrolase family protein [Bacteroidia bacterium]
MKVIGITNTDAPKKNLFYQNWIKNDQSDIEIVPLSYKENNLSDLEKCDAIVMSGGVDVYPGFYNST